MTDPTDATALIRLPRGGVIAQTDTGPIQLGIPPETIKDSMRLACGVPETFIVPQSLFHLASGISLAELEFPIYYNFFLRHRRTRIVCSQVQRGRLSVILREALFGPELLDYAREYVDGAETAGYPDLRAESDHFHTLPMADGVRRFEMADVVEFVEFDGDGRARVGDLEISADPAFNVTLRRGARVLAAIPRSAPLLPPAQAPATADRIFHPPAFGMTALGTGHGFDPDANTSGMVLWINRRGIMIDPPVHSTEQLYALGVNPKLIDSVILTHCHADHDAGTLQKVMQEGRINLYTTPTIFNSFMRKSAALTGIDEGTLRRFVRFLPVTLGESVNLNGGELRFAYTLHSIPTISVQADYLGKCIVYSSDTLDEPAAIRRLHSDGIIDAGRRDALLAFPWHADAIFHEAGVAPLHTPIEYLAGLPREVRERLYLVHVSRNSVPADSGLRIAPAGLANTVTVPVEPAHYDEAMEVLSILLCIDLFHELPLEKTREFLGIVRRETYAAGDYVFRQGDPGERFYIILGGRAGITADGRELATYADGDYFGEKALFFDEPRSASVQARTELRVLSAGGRQMRNFVRGTNIESTLRNLALFQDGALREALDLNPVLRRLSPSQQIQIHRMVELLPDTYAAGTTLIREETPSRYCYLVRSGRVEVVRKHLTRDTLGPGDLFGVAALLAERPASRYSFVVDEPATLARIDADAFLEVIRRNPGVYAALFFHDY